MEWHSVGEWLVQLLSEPAVTSLLGSVLGVTGLRASVRRLGPEVASLVQALHVLRQTVEQHVAEDRSTNAAQDAAQQHHTRVLERIGKLLGVDITDPHNVRPPE